MGCKGPVAFQNCPNVRWNEGTNWPVGCGHPCIGCAEADFWDKHTPFYQHLAAVPGFALSTNVDKIGLGLTGLTAAAFTAHGLVQLGKRRIQGDRQGRKDPETGGKAS
jgi:hydrogenase small subunit